MPLQDIMKEIEAFRPIHYLGSKLRMLDFIENVVNEIDPNKGAICDLFAGSGSVSFNFSKHRHVTAVDIQEYSRVICSALLNPKHFDSNALDNFLSLCNDSEHSKKLEWAFQPILQYENQCTQEALSGRIESLFDLLENGSIIMYELQSSKRGKTPLHKAIKESLLRIESIGFSGSPQILATRYFGGIYFSYKQTVAIDIILEQIFSLSLEKRDSYLAPLLGAISDAVNTIGKQFAQPIKPRDSSGNLKYNVLQKVLKDRLIDLSTEYLNWVRKYHEINPSSFKHETLHMDYSDALSVLSKKDVKVIYADPPYTRDHYSRYYHVLETICYRDNPEISTMVLEGETQISRGLYRKDRHQSPFCIKSQAPKAFEILFSKSRSLDAALLLSYSPFDESKNSHPRLLTMEKLVGLAKQHYRNVEIVSPGNFTHSKLNHSQKHLEALDKAELMLVCTI